MNHVYCEGAATVGQDKPPGMGLISSRAHLIGRAED